MAENPIILTQAAFDKLSAELQYLKTEGSAEVAARIGAARAEGDLSENGGYHAAKDEQGHMNVRIAQLEQMLRDAQVGVGLFEYTVAYFGDEDDPETFLLGSREMLGLDDDLDIQVYSPQSPLGAAVQSASAGDTVTYKAPNGKDIEVKILSVRPYTG
jgi:transcription elongation factor GreA